MKFLFAFLGLFVGLMTTDAKAQGISTAQGVHMLFGPGASTVGLTNWVPIVTRTTRIINGLSFYNTSTKTLEIGVATYGSTANSEVRQIILPPATQPNFVPLQINSSTRISIRALDSTAVTGEGDFSFFWD